MDKYRYGLRKHKRSNQTTPSVEEMTRHLLRRMRLSLAICLTACVTAMVGCSDSVNAPTQSAAVRSEQSKTDATEYEVTDLGSFGIGATISLAIDKQGTVLGRSSAGIGAEAILRGARYPRSSGASIWSGDRVTTLRGRLIPHLE